MPLADASRSLLIAALLSLGAVPAPARSQDVGWFAGLGIGHLQTSDAYPSTAAPGAGCEDKDTAWKIFGAATGKFNADTFGIGALLGF